MKTINRCIAGKAADAFSIDAGGLLMDMPCSSDKGLAVVYLEEALRNFTNAAEPISDELMWNAFIQYNKARAEYLLTMLGAACYDWESTLKTAIDYRSKLVAVLDDVLGKEEKTYLKGKYEFKVKELIDFWIC